MGKCIFCLIITHLLKFKFHFIRYHTILQVIEMTQEFLRKEDCSVIVVDWHGGSGPPYTQAVANIRLVGVMAAHLLGDLARYTPNNQLKHVHCIGHSLGAHICGYVGYTLQKVTIIKEKQSHTEFFYDRSSEF